MGILHRSSVNILTVKLYTSCSVLQYVGIHLPFEAVEYDPEWRGEGWKEDYTEDGRFKSDVRKKDKEL